MISIIAGYSGG